MLNEYPLRDVITDNERREMRARGLSAKLIEGTNDLVLKYQRKLPEITFIFGYERFFWDSRWAPKLGHHVRESDKIKSFWKKIDRELAKGERIVNIEDGEYAVPFWNNEWSGVSRDYWKWPNNFKTTNHMIIRTDLGTFGLDNIGEPVFRIFPHQVKKYVTGFEGKHITVDRLLDILEDKLRYRNEAKKKAPKKASKKPHKRQKVCLRCGYRNSSRYSTRTYKGRKVCSVCNDAMFDW